MNNIIKVGAVSYLNTKPLLHGILHSDVANKIALTLDYPSRLAKMLREGTLDVALLPVAAIPEITGAQIVSDYGIASDGNVVSVALFSEVPIDQIEQVYLDYQSRTSVRLAQLLLERHWKKKVEYLPAEEGYIDHIEGATAGVIIGDRALEQLNRFTYNYDLSAAWKAFSGLDFIFAAWVANKPLPPDFLAAFNDANRLGISQIDEVTRSIGYTAYDLNVYYKENIVYELDEQKREGLSKFLSLI